MTMFPNKKFKKNVLLSALKVKRSTEVHTVEFKQ